MDDSTNPARDLQCVYCMLMQHEQPSVKMRPDGKVRCADCEMNRLSAPPAVSEHVHFIEYGSCGHVVSQCRCPDLNKEVRRSNKPCHKCGLITEFFRYIWLTRNDLDHVPDADVCSKHALRDFVLDNEQSLAAALAHRPSVQPAVNDMSALFGKVPAEESDEEFLKQVSGQPDATDAEIDELVKAIDSLLPHGNPHDQFAFDAITKLAALARNAQPAATDAEPREKFSDLCRTIRDQASTIARLQAENKTLTSQRDSLLRAARAQEARTSIEDDVARLQAANKELERLLGDCLQFATHGKQLYHDHTSEKELNARVDECFRQIIAASDISPSIRKFAKEQT